MKVFTFEAANYSDCGVVGTMKEASIFVNHTTAGMSIWKGSAIMRRILYISLMSLFAVRMCSAETVEIPKPTSAQLAWQEAEIGALVCYELHTY